MLFGDWFDGWEIKANAFDLRVAFRHFDTEQSGGATYIAKASVRRKVEFFGKSFKVDPRKTCHPAEELLELLRIRVEFFEYGFVAVFGFVLRLTGAKGFRQIVPEPEQARVQHFQNSADIPRTAFIQVKSSSDRIEILGMRSVTLALEEFHSDQGVKEIADGTRVEANL